MKSELDFFSRKRKEIEKKKLEQETGFDHAAYRSAPKGPPPGTSGVVSAPPATLALASPKRDIK
jgi:hypothetical protein